MRLLAFILITISLTAGAIAATTAYVPRLDAAARAVEAGDTVTLGAPAGRTETADGAGEAAASPIVKGGVALTPELVERLRTAGVTRVRVKEFSFARWPLAWLFGLSVVGLLAGAALVRVDRARRVAAERASTTEEGVQVQSPAGAIAAIRAELSSLHTALAETTDPHQRQHLVTERAGDIQGTHIDSFLAARDRLIGRHGLAGFAQIMDRFSAMERQINRAWSAAADGVVEESADCIGQALRLVDDVEAAMRR